MNIEIANRLIKLRKEKGYSQESLASKLGISRQSVSKWERAESSPDTDNLICLAKLYGVSLDDLLDTDQSVEEIAKASGEKEDEKPIKKIKLNIDHKGVNLSFGKNHKSYNFQKEKLSEEEYKIATEKLHLGVWSKIKKFAFSFLSIAAIVVYLCLGILYETWGTLWIILLVPIFFAQFIKIFYDRDFEHLGGASVFLTVIVYFSLSYTILTWNISWVIFFAIPLFSIFGPLLNQMFKWGKKYKYRKIIKKYDDYQEDEDDDDDEDEEDGENFIIENV